MSSSQGADSFHLEKPNALVISIFLKDKQHVNPYNHHLFIISYQMLKNWKKKCEDDSETANWVNVNTKDCPKCHFTIEKNGGCNYMVS